MEGLLQGAPQQITSKIDSIRDFVSLLLSDQGMTERTKNMLKRTY